MSPPPIDATERMAPLPQRRSVGEVLDKRFRLEAPLGRGGFGEVWRASELLPDGSVVREVALKLLTGAFPGTKSPLTQELGDWAQEARVLAALRHPSLVVVYSAGLLELESPTPFVAMELLEGQTLAALIAERGRIPWRRAVAWAVQIAAALDAIHGKRVVHLDLKPANLFLASDGSVRVLDFGIARHSGQEATVEFQTGPTVDSMLGTGALVELHDAADSAPPTRARPIIGTPGYMAPEVLEGRDATPTADAYALGVCLFHLLAGRLPQRTRTLPDGTDAGRYGMFLVEVRTATLAGDLEDLDVVAPHVPKGVRAAVKRLLSIDPRAREGSLLEAMKSAERRPYGTPEPPYLGLGAYGREAEGILFGREADAERFAIELAERPFLVLQGASGSGKSSLAVAGIVPALARRFADDRDDWVAALVRPGQDLDGAIRKAKDEAGDDAARIGVVLVVDQLEEAVTQLDAEAEARFCLSLARYAGQGKTRTPGLRVLGTVREDFTTRVASLGALGAFFPDAVRFVAPPSIAAVRDIVVTPAALAGVSIDDEKPAVDEVLRELRAGEGRLPLVSFALTEWYRTGDGKRLTAAAWLRIGGVAGALAKHADATLAMLPESAKGAARDLCLRLVTAEGTRERVPASALEALGDDTKLALRTFVAARLVTLDDADYAAISHEALLTAWPTFARWYEEERADRAESSGLEAIAKQHARAQKEERGDLLLRGTRLARALDLVKRRPDLATPIAELVRVSQRKARGESFVKNGALFVVVAGSLTAAFLYWNDHRVTLTLEKNLRENMIGLQRDFAKLAAERDETDRVLATRDADLARAEDNLKTCKAGFLRAEQDRHGELANRFPADSFEQKIMSFVLLWEHLYNLHDVPRLGAMFADDVDWQGFPKGREGLATALETTFQKFPTNRVMVGEASIGHEDDKVIVRMTRDERQEGAQNLAVVRLTIGGDKPSLFRIEKAEIEKVVAQNRVLGCPK